MNDDSTYPIEDVAARLEIARLHEVVRHLAFMVNILTGFADIPPEAKTEMQKQLGLIAGSEEKVGENQ